MRRLIAGLVLSAALAFAQKAAPKDDAIYDQVRLKLAGDKDINGGGIDVEVHGGAVILKGKVMRAKQKQKAEHVARRVKGVKSVENQLVVDPAGR